MWDVSYPALVSWQWLQGGDFSQTSPKLLKNSLKFYHPWISKSFLKFTAYYLILFNHCWVNSDKFIHSLSVLISLYLLIEVLPFPSPLTPPNPGLFPAPLGHSWRVWLEMVENPVSLPMPFVGICPRTPWARSSPFPTCLWRPRKVTDGVCPCRMELPISITCLVLRFLNLQSSFIFSFGTTILRGRQGRY